MNQDRQILTGRIPAAAMWNELRSMLVRFGHLGISETDVSFGFAWEPIELEPAVMRLPLSALEQKVREEEGKGSGRLGNDDLILSHPDLPFEIQFCHEGDVHLWFEKASPVIYEVYADWQSKGFGPRDLVRDGYEWTERPRPADRAPPPESPHE